MSELPFVILTFRITVCMRAHTHVSMLCCGYRSHDYFLPLCCFCESGTGPELLSANPLTFLLAYISSFYFCVAQKLLLINCKTLLKMWKEFSLIHQDNKCCLHKNFLLHLFIYSECLCVLQYKSGNQKKAFGSQFSSFITWGKGLNSGQQVWLWPSFLCFSCNLYRTYLVTWIATALVLCHSVFCLKGCNLCLKTVSAASSVTLISEAKLYTIT